MPMQNVEPILQELHQCADQCANLVTRQHFLQIYGNKKLCKTQQQQIDSVFMWNAEYI